MFRDMFMSDPVGFYLEQVDYLRSYLSTLWSMTFEIELKTMLPMSSLVLYIVLYSSLPVVVLYHFFQTQATQQTIIQRVEKLENTLTHQQVQTNATRPLTNGSTTTRNSSHSSRPALPFSAASLRNAPSSGSSSSSTIATTQRPKVPFTASALQSVQLSSTQTRVQKPQPLTSSSSNYHHPRPPQLLFDAQALQSVKLVPTKNPNPKTSNPNHPNPKTLNPKKRKTGSQATAKAKKTHNSSTTTNIGLSAQDLGSMKSRLRRTSKRRRSMSVGSAPRHLKKQKENQDPSSSWHGFNVQVLEKALSQKFLNARGGTDSPDTVRSEMDCWNDDD